MMTFLRGLANGIREIRAHKLRSFLTSICVLLGVASLVLIVGFISGLFSTWRVWILEAGGLEKLTIAAIEPPAEQRATAALSDGLTLRDRDLIRAMSRFTSASSPEIGSGNVTLRHGGKSFETSLSGVTTEALTMKRQALGRGRMISPLDQTRFANVVVIGSKVREELFTPDEDPIGESISVDDAVFEIVGLLEKNDSGKDTDYFDDRKNKTVFAPLSSISRKLKGTDRLDSIEVRIADVAHLRHAMEELRNILFHSHHGIRDFEVRSNEEMIGNMTSMQTNFFVVGVGIGAITLVVGGIGIMNLMLASVKERIREIGIRKAVGARHIDIFLEFMAESVALSAIGGASGVVLGVSVILLLQRLMTGFAVPEISIAAVIVGFAFSVLVGIVSGIYPAWHASRLDPIEALRFN